MSCQQAELIPINGNGRVSNPKENEGSSHGWYCYDAVMMMGIDGVIIGRDGAIIYVD